MSPSISDPAAQGFARLVAIDPLEVTADGGRFHVLINKSHLQPAGIVHGGVYCTLVETAASVCAHIWLSENGGGAVVGVSNATDFLRPASMGTPLTAAATPLHRGTRQQLWLVIISDERGGVVARGQVRLQNLRDTQRPLRKSGTVRLGAMTTDDQRRESMH